MSRTDTSRPDRPDVAIFIPSYAGGGAERVAMFLARTLAEKGLRVDLVVARKIGDLIDEPLPGVNKVDLGAMNEMLAAPAWIRYLRRARPRCAMSMIHSANLISGIGAVVVPEVPVIVNLRIAAQTHPTVQWWFRSWFGFKPEGHLYQRVARVVGLSRGVANEAVEVFGVDPTRTRAILNPWQAWSGSLDIAPEHERLFAKPVVLGIGRLAPQKHFSMLLEAFSKVAESRDLHLVVLGQGPERDMLMERAKALGIADRVFFPGFVPNPQAYLRRARIFAFSSRNEGFGMALVEAMSAGTAIVSTDCPHGPSEVLDDGRFGQLVPVGDASAFAAALEAELDSPDVGHAARREARAEWMKQFEPEYVTQQYFDLIREVIAEHEG
jgi:glycosyltransferase involved in cell wall biosynthesis